MSIQGKVEEINSIKRELSVIGKRGKILRKRVKEIEREIEDYLDIKDQPGLKYKGTAIVKESTTFRKNKNKHDQKADAVNLLERYGINNAEKILEELNDVKKGEPEERTKLKFKSYKKKNNDL